jgi:hypothetical protein
LVHSTDQFKYRGRVVPRYQSLEGEEHEVRVEEDRVLLRGSRRRQQRCAIRGAPRRLTRMWQPAMMADGRMAVIEVMRIASGRKGSDMTIMPTTSDQAKM